MIDLTVDPVCYHTSSSSQIAVTGFPAATGLILFTISAFISWLVGRRQQEFYHDLTCLRIVFFCSVHKCGLSFHVHAFYQIKPFSCFLKLVFQPVGVNFVNQPPYRPFILLFLAKSNRGTAPKLLLVWQFLNLVVATGRAWQFGKLVLILNLWVDVLASLITRTRFLTKKQWSF